MQYDWVIRDVRVVRPEGILEADVAVNGSRLERIEPAIPGTARQEVLGRGRYLLPGLIDSHLSLTSDSVEEETVKSATQLALRGGITTVLELGAVQRPLDSAEAFHARRTLLEAQSLCDFGFILTAHAGNMEWMVRTLELGGAQAVRVDPQPTDTAMGWAARVDALLGSTKALVCLQPEAPEIIRSIEEGFRVHGLPTRHTVAHPVNAVLSACYEVLEGEQLGWDPARHEGRVYFPSLSAALEKRLLRRVRVPKLSLGVRAGHILLTHRDVERLGGQHGKVLPPLRLSSDRKSLRNALWRKQFDVLSSGHVPVADWEKALPYWDAPSGMPMLETALRVYLQGVRAGWLTLERLAWMGAEFPARMFRLKGKGRLEEGLDADLVLLSDAPPGPVQRTRPDVPCGWSLLEGMELPAGAASVWRRGTCVMQEGEWAGDNICGAGMPVLQDSVGVSR